MEIFDQIINLIKTHLSDGKEHIVIYKGDMKVIISEIEKLQSENKIMEDKISSMYRLADNHFK